LRYDFRTMSAMRRPASASSAGRAGAAARRNRVRIIAGKWRSRLLKFPPAIALRPTPDRVRETLFNWLGQRLARLACVDLFAGSGGCIARCPLSIPGGNRESLERRIGHRRALSSHTSRDAFALPPDRTGQAHAVTVALRHR